MFQYPHYQFYVESSKYWCCGPCLSTPSIFRSPSGHLSYCHHFASVVCKLFSFQSSSPKLHGALEPNLACMLIKWYFTYKVLSLLSIGNSTWMSWSTMCFNWLIFQKSSSQKRLCRFNYNIVEMFIR